MPILIIAVAPALALIIYFYHKDKYEKEPLSLLGKAFFAGFLVTLLVILIETILLTLVKPVKLFILEIFLKAFLIAALVEEGAKFVVFRSMIYNDKEFNEPYDGIVYAVMISLGFATLENILYVITAFFKFGILGVIHVGMARAIFAVPSHAFDAVIMGYFFGLAKFTKNTNRKKSYLYSGLVLAILAHGLYDFLILSHIGAGALFMLVLFIFCWRISLKFIKIQIGHSPFKD